MMPNRLRPLVASLLCLVAGTACVSVRDSSETTTAPSPARTTRVMLTASEHGAEVWVDGKFRGTAPVSLQLTAGEHDVEIRRAGFETWIRPLTIVADDSTNVNALLQPAGAAPASR